MNPKVPDCLKELFSTFYQKVQDGKIRVDTFEQGASEAEIQMIEQQLGLPLPASFRSFLTCANGFSLARPLAYMHRGHVWFHPTDTICFAEYFKEADGDQAVFDISQGLIDGEYPVLYYAHDFARDENKGLRKIADSFAEWFNGL
jgi:hypothetical protein